MTDQSDAGGRKRGYILTTDQSDAGSACILLLHFTGPPPPPPTSESRVITTDPSDEKKGTPAGVVNRARGPSYWAAGRTGLLRPVRCCWAIALKPQP
eukprot:1175604-Prorocentrum_minimum.AAC.1